MYKARVFVLGGKTDRNHKADVGRRINMEDICFGLQSPRLITRVSPTCEERTLYYTQTNFTTLYRALSLHTVNSVHADTTTVTVSSSKHNVRQPDVCMYVASM